jgi:hypothetical protein
MSYRHTFEAALESLKEIEQLIVSFPEDGRMSGIDIDLTLQKMRNVYELMLMVKQESTTNPSMQAPPVQPVRTPEVSRVSEQKIAPPVEDKPVQAVEVEQQPAPVEEMPVTAAKVPEPEKTVEPAAPVVKKVKEKKEPKTLADQFQGAPTLHERLHQNMTREEDTLSHAKPIKNLVEAIGINDRYTFVRELFNGDNAKFESAIHFLNEAGSFNDAYNYMIMYFSWDMDSEPVQLLLDIIRRKFIKHRHE